LVLKEVIPLKNTPGLISKIIDLNDRNGQRLSPLESPSRISLF